MSIANQTQETTKDTLHQPGVAFLLHTAEADGKSARHLHALWMRGNDDTPEHDAIFDGYWALKLKVEGCVESLRSRGGLLFFGQAQALAIARALIQGGAA